MPENTLKQHLEAILTAWNEGDAYRITEDLAEALANAERAVEEIDTPDESLSFADREVVKARHAPIFMHGEAEVRDYVWVGLRADDIVYMTGHTPVLARDLPTFNENEPFDVSTIREFFKELK